MKQLQLKGPAGAIAVHVSGDERGIPVLLSHSILSSSTMWNEQATLLAARGMRVVCMDTRGHGGSAASPPPYAMDDLVADTIAVLDALQIARVHFVGLSLGCMTGFGLGIRHADRVASLCLCDGRADAPADYAAPWNDRIASAKRDGCGSLAVSTTERWFGKDFLAAHPQLAQRFRDDAAATSVDGFVGCAQAIQKLDYLPQVGRISAPTTLVVGANDGPLPQVMQAIQELIAGSVLEVIPGAGHLPNIDQPDAFNAALLRHFARVAAH